MDVKWQFWIDRGGTFTDVIAHRPDGRFTAHKYLSENPERYQDAAVFAMREIMGIAEGTLFPSNKVESIKMGTTVATNALLERKGDPLLLIVSQGLRDALEIGYQARPKIFARQIEKPSMLYAQVADPVSGRVDNVLAVHSLHPAGLAAHFELYRAVMRGTRSLPKAEREMIAIVVSKENGCHY